ncbi:MAG: toll/interleukin-1 receptor domain-containing protein [Hyphomonadaceae bacterium]|nr:toll/interleukin-1 receptor domain-containing protein [Hyphomonadaceae bacterium]
MPDAYVSFAREDRDRVEPVVRALEARGFDVWWKPEIPPDAPAAAAALRDSKAVLAAWSPAAARTEAVAAELEAGRGRLLPFLIEALPVEPHAAFAAAPVDLAQWPDAAAAPDFERLVQALAARRGRPATAITTRSGAGRFQPAILLAAALSVVAVAVLLVSNLVRPPDFLAPAPGAPEYAETEGEATDSPGAAERYGLAKLEIDALPPQELIELAMQRTSIEAIEAEAAAGDAFGLTLLCLARSFGEGLDRDQQAARRACEQGSAAGDALATFMLSNFARAGAEGYAPNAGDIAEADRLLAQAAAAGDARAETELGRKHLLTDQSAEAAPLVRSAADKGYLPAQVFLGWMFEQGRGVEKDYQRAMAWYARAGRSGSPAGMRALGALYEQGLGVARDYGRAREQYQGASNRGDGEASWRLGRMFERGLGGARDMARARELYSMALAQGYQPAQADVLRVGRG